ncbi:MAG: hypothetical protein J6W52_03385 [Bacteroidaceae bacterium]|nr:hypothetical protein [Bacteroidaceae bacterium]
MRYLIHSSCRRNIVDFYRHVAMKYRNTYSKGLMLKNIDEAVEGMYLIEKTLSRRCPTLEKWKKEGWNMTNAGKWYYAYTISDDTIIIQDACHAQNMHD